MPSHIVASRHSTVTSDRPGELDALLTSGAALCRRPGADPDHWYPTDERLADDEEYAKKACAGCPFAGLGGACLKRAELLPYDNYGVIGGIGPKKRRHLGIGIYDFAEVAA
ncbi:WhiB family transcriptional regulator [Microbispora bryophytorum]|uniref:WhiB family transcriptional regulator n=1 Tax=Microbispora bryophytorum TaxID=1460882 RepID=UPI0033D68948